MSITFSEFYTTLGFTRYPFATFNTESETNESEKLYVKPQNYSIITQLFSEKTSVVIHGERGTGKTALASELLRQIQDSKDIYVVIDDFKELKVEYVSSDLYQSITNKIAESYFSWLARHPNSVWKLSKEERIKLTFYLQHYVRPVSKEVLRARIFAIQNPWYKRCTVVAFNHLRGIFNYGLNACAAFTNDIVTRHFPGLPSNTIKYHEYLGELKMGTDLSFDKEKHEFNSLSKLCEIIHKTGVSRIIVKVDKLDEDPRFHNSAEDISDFIKNLACDNTLLLHDKLQIVLFMWTTPFNYIKDSVRTQKLNVQKLEWNNQDLLKALDKRLAVYSDGKVSDHNKIINSKSDAFKVVLNLSNHNPRDLWHILDKCMQAQFKIDPIIKIIQDQAMMDGVKEFVSGFNFYEYYPRKSNSRANSLDIYSYIRHLSKLSSTAFTKDRFNRDAGTGSSTNNYVTAMENMGLIVRSEEKESGAALYKIKDPKVVFAMEIEPLPARSR